jgi:hypothetical protein
MRWLTRWLAGRPTPPPCRTITRPQVEPLEERQVPTVNYYGGPLLTQVEAQALFYGGGWSPDPTPSAPTTDKLNTFLGDITNGPYFDTLTRAGYGVRRGSADTGVFDTAALTGGSTITDASIQSAIQADVTKGLLKSPDANRLYVVFVQPNVAVSLGGFHQDTKHGILGYHSAFGGKDASGNATTIRYAVIA